MDDFELDYADIQSEYEAELIDKAIADLSTDNIRLYLAANGDAIETRVTQTLAEAEQLLTSGYPGSALTSAVTSIEIILRFFVFRRILHGAFLPEQ